MGMPVIVASNIDRCEAITDIIQSVALEQAALSHILNAEGEKIQAVVAMKGATTKELLETNKSVRSMVDTISRLEIILQSKLSLFEDCLCECPDNCKTLENTNLVAIDKPNITVKQTDKNNYTVTGSIVDYPAEFKFSTTPNVPVEAILLQEGMKFEDNILYVDKNLGRVVLMAGKGDCAEQINISFVQIS